LPAFVKAMCNAFVMGVSCLWCFPESEPRRPYTRSSIASAGRRGCFFRAEIGMDFLMMWSVPCKFSDVSSELTSPSLLVKCSLRKVKWD